MCKAEKIVSLIITVLMLLSCSEADMRLSDNNNGYCVMIGAEKEKLLSLHDYGIIILDAEYLTPQEISQIHNNRNAKIYSYLNIGAIEDFRKCYDEFLPMALGDYENWENEKWIDVSEKKWQEYISETSVWLMSKGIDGIFADNADVYYNYPSEEIFSGLTDIFTAFDNNGYDVIVNGGDTYITEAIKRKCLPESISGINQETVFSSIDFESLTFASNTQEERDYFLEYISICSSAGLDIYLTEYSKDNTLKAEIAEYCNESNYYYYISDNTELS